MSDDLKPWEDDDVVLIGPNGNPIIVREISSGFSSTTIFGLKIPFATFDLHPPSCSCDICSDMRAFRDKHVRDEEPPEWPWRDR